MPDTFIHLIRVYSLKLSGWYWSLFKDKNTEAWSEWEVKLRFRHRSMACMLPQSGHPVKGESIIQSLSDYSFCSPYFHNFLFKLPRWIPIIHMRRSLFDLASTYASSLTTHHSPNWDPHETMCSVWSGNTASLHHSFEHLFFSTKTIFLHIYPENPCSSSKSAHILLTVSRSTIKQ